MGKGHCTGALITTWPVPMIVTAAHCSEEKTFTVFANRYDSALSTASERGLEFTVKKIVDHPGWNNVTGFNDIAVWVLQLKSNPSNLDLQTFPNIAINTNPSCISQNVSSLPLSGGIGLSPNQLVWPSHRGNPLVAGPNVPGWTLSPMIRVVLEQLQEV